ncbi:MAG: hypothetical protein L0Y54_16950 [Sporichthyaceae bacterium]|nr:hypothetical protein [Sporichthyaceae bacterium]
MPARGATPAPFATAAQAAVWFGKTCTRGSGTRNLRSNRLVSLCGSAPVGSTSQGQCRASPRGRPVPAPTTMTLVRNTGSLYSSPSAARLRSGPSATSASRLATSTGISPALATPQVVSTALAVRRLNASVSGVATNSAIGAGGDDPQRLGRAPGGPDLGLGLGRQRNHLRRDRQQPGAARGQCHPAAAAHDELVTQVQA